MKKEIGNGLTDVSNSMELSHVAYETGKIDDVAFGLSEIPSSLSNKIFIFNL